MRKGTACAVPFSNQFRVPLNRSLNPLRFDADVSLCDSGGAVLQEALDKGDVIAVCLVDLGGVPLAEAVGADALKSQIVTDDGELLLDRPFGDREYAVIALDAIAQTVILNVLLDHQRDGEHSALACLLFDDLQTVAVPIQNDVAGTEAQNVADAQAQIAFQNKSRGNALIWATAAKALLHRCDDLFVLLCCQSFCFLIHGSLQK